MMILFEGLAAHLLLLTFDLPFTRHPDRLLSVLSLSSSNNTGVKSRAVGLPLPDSPSRQLYGRAERFGEII